MKAALAWSLSFLFAACGPAVAPDDTGPGDIDAGPSGADAGPRIACEAAADCDDGLFCTGEESCADGFCEAGAPPSCDDGVACTLDRCDELAARCRSLPRDRDGDGAGDAACLGLDGAPLGTDCDDDDDRRFRGNIERCDVDHVDEDCDPSTFGAEDLDGDGALSSRCCNGDLCGDDCDDSRSQVGPGALEICNGLDEDCDGVVDEESVRTGFVDLDADGYGDDSAGPIEGCEGQARFATRGGDCDDTTPNVRPGLSEICDEIDNDCDDIVDEQTSDAVWYTDSDGDGYGDPRANTLTQCEVPEGFALLPTDCADDDAERNPAAVEACNGLDDDCNGVADFILGVNDFEDDDGDGVTDARCEAPGPRDCDDLDPRSSSLAFELCDGRDNDCDGAVDEGAASGVWFPDRDGDGFGDSFGVPMVSCNPLVGYVPRAGDCDDSSGARFPGAAEACDGRDDDCDFAVDEGAALVCGPGRACNDGRCSLVCPLGSADCDGDVSNSCEVDTFGSPEHCGGCGQQCGVAGSCIAGACDALAEVALGEGFTCVRRVGGGVACWGDNSAGQCGLAAGAPDIVTQPRELLLPAPAVRISAGAGHACALLANDELHCWGDNSAGQIGIGTTSAAELPAQVAVGSITWTEVSLGGDFTCAAGVTSGGARRLRCWGANARGQLGVGGTDPSTTPELVGAYRDVACGLDFCCANAGAGSRETYCWGANDASQLGMGNTADQSVPLEVGNTAFARSYTVVRPGGRHTCALRTAQVYCWGDNAAGEIDPEQGAAHFNVPQPLNTEPLLGWAPGRGHLLMRRSADELYGTGANTRGQLGRGDTTASTAHAPVVGGFTAQTLGQGPAANHACAVNAGILFCWGDNRRGQLGLGITSEFTAEPRRVPDL